MKTILFADTETCGFMNDRLPDDHPAQPPLVQLGAVLCDADNGAEFATIELIVKPDGYRIPDAAARVHGITTAIAERFGVPLSLVLPAYVHLGASADAVAFYNAPFDLRILAAAFARNGRPVTIKRPNTTIDVAQLATPVVAMPRTERMEKTKLKVGAYKTPKLVEAYRHLFGRDFPGEHGALADARAAKEVFFELRRLEEAARVSEDECPGHVGSLLFGKAFCAKCGTNVEALR